MMNSVYKKIALVCVTSLAVNQAAQAFQFSDMWNWIKENRTISATLIGGMVAAMIVLMRSKSKSAVKNRKLVLYASESALKPNFSTKSIVVMPISNKKTFAEQFSALSESLAALTNTPKGFIASVIDKRPNFRVLTLVDVSKSGKQAVSFDKPTACVVFTDQADGDAIIIEWMATGKSGNLKEMLQVILATKKDIVLCDGMQRDFVEEQITAVDGVKPRYEAGMFKRGIKSEQPKPAQISHEEYRAHVRNLMADRERVRRYLGDAVFNSRQENERLAAQLEQAQRAAAISSPAVPEPA